VDHQRDREPIARVPVDLRQAREPSPLETMQMDAVACETPVALVYNGVSHAVMLATPADLYDFALGFSLTEGIIASPEDVFDVEVKEGAQGIEVSIGIASRQMQRLSEHRRSLAGRTGCGLCGAEQLSQLVRPLPALPPESSAQRFTTAALQRARASLRDHQPLFAETGAVHAAAWADINGEILAVREDVGRHNALDKLLGFLRCSSAALDKGFLLVTSRASFEMVHKAASQQIGLLAAVSAPTSLAVETAERLGVSLVGFLREESFSIYTHGQRIV
jgi:FdhD protein